MDRVLKFPTLEEREKRKNRFVATHMEKIHGIVVVPGDVLIKADDGAWRKE